MRKKNMEGSNVEYNWKSSSSEKELNIAGYLKKSVDNITVYVHLN